MARKEGERWLKDSGPSGVKALFSPAGGGESLAGAADAVWRLADGRWRREEKSPAGVVAFAADPGGALWALAPSGGWRQRDGWELVNEMDEDMGRPRKICAAGPEDVYVAAEKGLFALMGKRKYWLSVEVRPGGLLSSDVRDVALFGAGQLLVATDRGLNITDGAKGWYSCAAESGLPLLDLTQIATAPDGTIWLGSPLGLIRWQKGRWTYLSSKRWLPDDRVTAIAPCGDGSVWVGTGKGLAHLTGRELTLAEKAAMYQKDLESRDRRFGYVTVLSLRSPGSLDGALQEVSDNDGLWTSLYIASQSFRHAAAKSPEARAQAWRSMQALLRLESLTGIPGFPARAVSHAGEPGHAGRSSGEWHPSPVEKDWTWKGETSSDELDGHFFAFHIYHELVASDEEKKPIRATCKRIMDHILDHGYTLVDLDGKPTTWGVWSPEKLNDDPRWWQERGLNSLEILSHLKVASRIVGDPRYEKAYRELIEKHHFALNAMDAKLPPPEGVSHDNQLAFLAYYPLLQLEKDPELRALYRASLRRTWSFERVEANPLWNFIFGASMGPDEPFDVEEAVGALREMPLDLIAWRMKNSVRADLKYDPLFEKEGKKQLVRPLPWTERPVHKWDHSPFNADGGSNLQEVDQTLWLLPYWMGRYHQLIE
jgi:hypothetical protein